MIGLSRIAAFALIVVASAGGGNACAMNTMAADRLSCSVEGEAKLPAEIGGEESVCAAISEAVLPALRQAGIAPGSVAVTVRLTSPSTMSAVASVGGRALAEQKVGVSDRPLNAHAVRMLAQAVAAELAKSRK